MTILSIVPIFSIPFLSIFSSSAPSSSFFFFFNDPAPTEISTLPLHDALPIFRSPPAPLHLPGLPTHRVDDHLAGSPRRRIGGRRRSLDERDQEHGCHHWFGRVNLPPSPVTRFAVTTLKSGSAVKPCPLMCRVGSSNTNAWSELTWFLAWL